MTNDIIGDRMIKRMEVDVWLKNSEKITISDIANAVGVSKTTISRYLNGHEELMSKSTRDRIKAVIEMCDYRPSEIARNLKKQKSNLIGMIISDIVSPFSSAVIVGISDYLEAKGYTPLIVNCEDSLEREENAISSLLAKGVSGLIVNTTSCYNKNLINEACKGLPVVLCDRYIKDYNFDIVTLKHKESINELIIHLKDQGYTRPFLFTQNWEYNSARYIRRDCFIESVKSIFGYDPTDDIYTISSKDNHSASLALSQLLKSLKSDDIPVIMGINSVTTVRTFRAIKELGLKIPQDIGICGSEDWDWEEEMNWANLVSPSITTTVVPSTLMGRRCAELLLLKIENSQIPQKEILLPCELRIRKSTLRK